jgi:membrane protein
MKPKWKIPLFRRLHQAYRNWREDDGDLMAAAVGYYAALSFFPILLILISGLGMVLRWSPWGADAETQVVTAISDYASPAVAKNVGQILSQVQKKAALGGPLGLGILLFASLALFVRFEQAFDRIWDVEPRAGRGMVQSIRSILFFRMRAFLMLLAVGGLVVVVFVSGLVLSSVKTYAEDWLPAAQWTWWLIEIGTSLILNGLLFTVIYRVLPKVTVRWSDALQGGVLAAVAWELGRLILSGFLISKKYSAYGVVGSFIAIMLWIYFASTIVFLAAEYVQLLRRERSPDKPADEFSID